MAELDEVRQQLELLSDEELMSVLREHDDGQWRPEVFDIVRSILARRGVSTEEECAKADFELENEILDEESILDLVTAAEYIDIDDAQSDGAALEEKGVRAWIFSQSPAATPGFESGVQLKVQSKDWKKAMDLLGLTFEQPAPSWDLPDDIAEPPCPHCGSWNVTEHAEVLEEHSTPAQAWLYRCASCGYRWSDSNS